MKVTLFSFKLFAMFGFGVLGLFLRPMLFSLSRTIPVSSSPANALGLARHQGGHDRDLTARGKIVQFVDIVFHDGKSH